MRVVALPRAFYQIAWRRPQELSEQAAQRLRWVCAWQRLMEQGQSSTQAAQTLGIPRATLYRWRRRLLQRGPLGLEDGSHRPKRPRRPRWTPELAQAILALRQEYPHWGKEKLVVLLRRQGWRACASQVGRVLHHLKARGVLREPPRSGIRVRRRLSPRPYAVRKPKTYQPVLPGDLVQVDTVDLRPVPGVAFKHFTARDVVSRWDVVAVARRATATTAATFLDTLQKRYPFPIKAIQVDGGSEFHAGFEAACQQRGFRLFVLPPHSPKLNGCVERANRTHREEFYELYDGALDLPSVNAALHHWEHVYNTIRPHQALAYATPLEYLQQCHPELAPPIPHPVSYVLNQYISLTP